MFQTNFSEFNPDNVLFGQPEKKDFGSQIKIWYNYGDGKPHQCTVEGPVCTVNGIYLNEQKEGDVVKASSGPPIYSVMCVFKEDDENAENVAAFRRLFEAVHFKAIMAIYEQRMAIRPNFLSTFNKKGLPEDPTEIVDAASDSFASPVREKKDKKTNMVVPDAPKSIYFATYDYSKPGDEKTRNDKTVFTDPDGEVIDISLLLNTSFECIPLVRIVHIWIGRALSIKCTLVSAIVVSPPRPHSMMGASRQSGTIAQLRAANPDLAMRVQEQLAVQYKRMEPRIPSSERPDPSAGGQTRESYSGVLDMAGTADAPIERFD